MIRRSRGRNLRKINGSVAMIATNVATATIFMCMDVRSLDWDNQFFTEDEAVRHDIPRLDIDLFQQDHFVVLFLSLRKLGEAIFPFHGCLLPPHV
jgi:hypothetical protein